MTPTRLCTIADVKTQGNINVAYEYEDETLVRSIEAATTAIFSVTRRRWLLGEYNDRTPVPRTPVRGTFRIWTEVRPLILAPKAPKVSVSRGFSPIGATALSSKQFSVSDEGRIDIDPESILNWNLGGFIHVNYVAGLASLPDDPVTFDAPADMRTACAMQAAYMYDRIVNNKVGVKQFAGKTGSTTYSTYANGLVPEAHALVGRYVKPHTGG